ncbi:MAG: DUF2202 domain-containing protein [Phycisphaerales bacterium]|nr:DUF2202 domain-containing protein [Phycisphaerales bacterium]
MPGPGPHATDAAHCTEDGPLSAEVAHDVLHMREEEKLARDVYLTLYDVWGLQIFNNISASEQRHMDAVLDLIVCYELIDPVVDDTVGVFTDPVFAALYVSLVDMGTNSVMSALQVGALIEELDIADLQIALVQSDNPDVTLVFENLLQGSENHLRAFDKQITRAGGVYVPQYLTQEEYDAIVDGAGNNGSQHQNGAFTQSQERFRYLPTVDTTP